MNTRRRTTKNCSSGDYFSQEASGGSGLLEFAGVINKPATVTVGGSAAIVNHATTNFAGYARRAKKLIRRESGWQQWFGAGAGGEKSSVKMSMKWIAEWPGR
jgi:hypothetical protein